MDTSQDTTLEVAPSVRRTEALLAQMDDLPLTLNTTQAARLCGVSPTTIRAWVKQGLPTLPFDGDLRYSTEALREFMRTASAA